MGYGSPFLGYGFGFGFAPLMHFRTTDSTYGTLTSPNSLLYSTLKISLHSALPTHPPKLTLVLSTRHLRTLYCLCCQSMKVRLNSLCHGAPAKLSTSFPVIRNSLRCSRVSPSKAWAFLTLWLDCDVLLCGTVFSSLSAHPDPPHPASRYHSPEWSTALVGCWS